MSRPEAQRTTPLAPQTGAGRRWAADDEGRALARLSLPPPATSSSAPPWPRTRASRSKSRDCCQSEADRHVRGHHVFGSDTRAPAWRGPTYAHFQDTVSQRDILGKSSVCAGMKESRNGRAYWFRDAIAGLSSHCRGALTTFPQLLGNCYNTCGTGNHLHEASWGVMFSRVPTCEKR